MGYPDPIKYHETTHITRLLNWHTQLEHKPWVTLEQSMIDSQLAGLPWLPNLPDLASITKHPLIPETL